MPPSNTRPANPNSARRAAAVMNLVAQNLLGVVMLLAGMGLGRFV